MPNHTQTTAFEEGANKGKRRRCKDCWRLEAQCLCEDLPSLVNDVELVFLQHPLEKYQVKGTARLAALSLKKASFWVGETFDSQQQKAILGQEKQVFLLYPALDDLVKVMAPEELVASETGVAIQYAYYYLGWHLEENAQDVVCQSLVGAVATNQFAPRYSFVVCGNGTAQGQKCAEFVHFGSGASVVVAIGTRF